MKKLMIIIVAVLFVNLTIQGQNLFLIGEKSYPSTDAITLESNSDAGYDLNVFLIKDGNSGLIAVSKESHGGMFTGKLIIYLEDGNVVSCNNMEASEQVDDRIKALYNLTSDQVNKLKISNIHTVKYTNSIYGNFSASNKGVETNAIISEFFNE